MPAALGTGHREGHVTKLGAEKVLEHSYFKNSTKKNVIKVKPFASLLKVTYLSTLELKYTDGKTELRIKKPTGGFQLATEVRFQELLKCTGGK